MEKHSSRKAWRPSETARLISLASDPDLSWERIAHYINSQYGNGRTPKACQEKANSLIEPPVSLSARRSERPHTPLFYDLYFGVAISCVALTALVLSTITFMEVFYG